MYDMHFNLLTILYWKMKRHGDFQEIGDFILELPLIYNQYNIIGGIINLYFDSIEDMQKDFKFSKSEITNVLEMFVYSLELLENLKELDLINENTDFIFGIEGATHIEIEDLYDLYRTGLRSLAPIANEKNRYGNSFKEEGGLTEEGKKLIEKMIELGIIIDVSNTNEETFFDIIDIVEEKIIEGKNPLVVASFQNIKERGEPKQHLTEKQLLELKECEAYISLSTRNNLSNQNNNILKNIEYLLEDIKFDQDKIILASNDMSFNPNSSYNQENIITLKKVKEETKKLLLTKYSSDFINQIMHKNAQDLFQAAKEKEKMYKL